MSDRITRWNEKKHLRSSRIAALQLHLSRETQGKHLGHVIIIGNVSVGKSCILIALQGNVVPHSMQSTVAVDFCDDLQPMGPQLSLRVCDLPGQSYYYTRCSVMNMYLRNTDVVLVVFDCTDTDSFNNVGNWYNAIAQLKTDLPYFILVCNKTDMKNERVVSTEQALACAEKYNMEYLEISTWANENIHLLGQTISSLTSDMREFQSFKPHQTIRLQVPKFESKCCLK